jgi:hypothetical protein
VAPQRECCSTELRLQYQRDLLAEINRDLPVGVDWKAGARSYVANCFEKSGREPTERHSMNKPFVAMRAAQPGGNCDSSCF